MKTKVPLLPSKLIAILYHRLISCLSLEHFCIVILNRDRKVAVVVPALGRSAAVSLCSVCRREKHFTHKVCPPRVTNLSDRVYTRVIRIHFFFSPTNVTYSPSCYSILFDEAQSYKVGLLCFSVCNITLDSKELLSRSNRGFGQIKSPSIEGPTECTYKFIPDTGQRVELQIHRLLSIGRHNGKT